MMWVHVCTHLRAHSREDLRRKNSNGGHMDQNHGNEIAITKIARRSTREGQMARKVEGRSPAAMLRTHLNARFRSDPSRTRESKRVKSVHDKLTLGSSKHASVPGLRFLRSEKTPSSNFFMFRTGRPKASNRKTSERTMSVPVMW